MTHRLLLAAVTILLVAATLQGASAAIADNLQNYWPLNETSATANATDRISGHNGTAAGNPGIAACPIGGGRSFNGAQAFTITNTSTYLRNVGTGNFTISVWFITNTTAAGNRQIVNTGKGTSPYNGIFLESMAGGNLSLEAYNASTTGGAVYYGSNASNNSWNHLVARRNGTNISIFLNGVHINSTSIVANLNLNGVGQYIGTDNTNRYFNGSLCSVGIWNRSLTTTEIAQLYDFEKSGTGYPWVNVTNTTYTFSASDLYNLSALTGVTITTSIGNCTITTGTCNINTSNHGLGTLSFNASKNGYFNTSGTITPNTTATANMTQGVYTNVTVYSVITNATVAPPFNLTTSGGRTYLLDGTATAVYLRAGENNLTFNKTGWYGLTASKTVTALTNTTTNMTGAYNLVLNVYARNASNSSITNSTNITVENATHGYAANCTTTNGTCAFNLLQGSYTVDVNPAGYEFKETNFTASTTTYNLYSVHYTKNSISFRFVDEETYALVNTTTVYFELISTVFSANYTTSNGTAYVDLLSPASYNIRYVAAGYAYRFYSLTLEDNNHYDLNLTMLNETAASNVTITVQDTLGNDVIGAVVKILKYDVTTNSYVLNQVLTTNFEGKVVASILLNQEYYQFIVEYEGSQVYQTTPTYIYSTEFTLYVPLTEGGFDEHLTVSRLTGNITHSNITHLATYTWNDANNLASQACLYAYSFPALTLENSSCTASAAGSMTMTISNTTGKTYLLKGYVTTGGEDYLVAVLTVSYEETASTGRGGLLYGVLLFLVFVFIGFWSLTIAVLFGGLAPLFLTITGLWAVPYSVTVPLFVLSVIVAYIVGRRSA